MSIVIRIVEGFAGAFALFYFIGSIAEENKGIKEAYSASSFACMLLIIMTEFMYLII